MHVCYVAACLCFLTVVNAYMQLDFPQIYHGGHAEKKQNVRGENVTSLQESVCVCVAAGLTGQIRVVQPEGAACFQPQEGSAAQ